MTVLETLLAENRGYAFEYAGGLTNHASMALVALARLHAPDARLRAFFDVYRARLEPAAEHPRTARTRSELAGSGVDRVLRAELSAAASGIAGGAFHGLIRVAFARSLLEAAPQSAQEELAPALAYLAECAQPLFPYARGRECDLDALVARLRAVQIEKPRGSLISERLTTVASDERFAAVIGDLRVDGSTLTQVSGLGARWYLASDDFVSLHVLTGAHALRSVLPHFEGPALALHALAAAALASFVVCGMPETVDARGRERAEWSEIDARAIASDDDHLAKLVVACRDEEQAVSDAIYRIVATRVARRGHT